MQLIKEGRAGVFAPECGTQGLATCVGLAVSAGPNDFSQWFLAHINCDSPVPPKAQACYDAVRDEAAAIAQRLRPPIAGARVYIVTNAGDLSAQAIRDGLTLTYGADARVEGYLGFYVDAGGDIHFLQQGENTEEGTDPFSIPRLSPPCP